MSIINITDDSFYASSRHNTVNECLKAAENAICEGSDILDIGAFSSRPGATEISKEEEFNRILTVLSSLRKEFPYIPISIDTFRSEVAEMALQNGATIINDISGGNRDMQMFDTIAKWNCPYILMHMRGTPSNMQNHTEYENIFNEIIFWFSHKISLLENLGVHDIIIDPGYGFSKTLEQNHFLLKNSRHFRMLHKPVLTGISRKSMWYKLLNTSAEEALNATIFGNLTALMQGSSILRVHDTKAAKELIKLYQLYQ